MELIITLIIMFIIWNIKSDNARARQEEKEQRQLENDRYLAYMNDEAKKKQIAEWYK